MYTEYHVINIPTKKMQDRCKRRHILRRGIKTACGVTGFLAFFYMVGAVGGLEHDMMTIKQFMIHTAMAVITMAVSAEINSRV